MGSSPPAKPRVSRRSTPSRPENPVTLNDEAHHSVWVNSKALELAGITRDTTDPEGGIIERDSSGEPTALLRDSATRLVSVVSQV